MTISRADSVRRATPGKAGRPIHITRSSRRPATLGSLILFALLAACGGGDYEVELMPAPAVYADGELSPFPKDFDPAADDEHGIFYATLREPAGPDGDSPSPYLDKRGAVARIGIGRVELASGPTEWEELLRVSFAGQREDNIRLRLLEVEEFGVLGDTVTEFTDPAVLAADPSAPGRRFAAAVNAELRRSARKEILVYVHGYKVPFPDPILVATELWHFLGYEGAVVAFSWPSTPNRLAYFSDLDTANVSAFGFRKFLQFLARETEAERIHILGYSAGTRMVTLTAYQLALINKGLAPDTARANTKLGQIILVGGDVGRDLVGTYLEDGLLDSIEGLTIYMSEADRALGVSRFLLSYDRLGQMFDGPVSGTAADYLFASDNLHLINVTEAEGATGGNGHGYFRQSPWASSDILATIRYGLGPAERGLVRGAGSPIWTFPPDYVARLRRAILEQGAAATR